MRIPLSSVSVFMACALALACAGDTPDDAASDDAATPAPETAAAAPASDPIAAVGLENAAEPLPGIVSAAQPRRIQVEELIDLGFTRFISLRPAEEEGAGWEELALRGQDVQFTRIPVAGAPGLTRENVEALDRALAEAGADTTIVYCSSSNRVGALLALRAHWIQGAPAQEALELGRRAGLAGLEPTVREMMGLN